MNKTAPRNSAKVGMMLNIQILPPTSDITIIIQDDIESIKSAEYTRTMIDISAVAHKR